MEEMNNMPVQQGELPAVPEEPVVEDEGEFDGTDLVADAYNTLSLFFQQAGLPYLYGENEETGEPADWWPDNIKKAYETLSGYLDEQDPLEGGFE